MSIDLVEAVLEDPRWEAVGLQALSERAARAALVALGLDPARYEISLLGCDDARMAALNGAFRGKAVPTNVLSWPAFDLDPEGGPPPPTDPTGGPVSLGDLALAFETCTREAEERGLTLANHVTHLVVHGCLHLLGHDHVAEADAARMEGLETKILATLGVADPYCE